MPSLPFELERQIFEIAALQDTNYDHRIQIILVAKRVYEWIRPILYRVVVIRNTLFETSGALTICNLPNPQITSSARFVRHLLTVYNRDSRDVLLELISTFPNIENLAIWGSLHIPPQVLQKLNDLPLRRLSFASFHVATEYCSAFKNFTHLEIHGLNGLQDDRKALIELPKLTHLSFDFSHVEGASVLDLLKHYVSLQVLIQFINSSRNGESTIKLDDPRYLVLRNWQLTVQDLVEEWTRSANGLIGYWELAEVIIEARKANFFKDTTPSVLSRKTCSTTMVSDGTKRSRTEAEPEEDFKVQH